MKDKKEDFSRKEKIKPIYIYEDVMYGQKVIVKRYPSNIPVMELPYNLDETIMFTKDIDQFVSSKK